MPLTRPTFPTTAALAVLCLPVSWSLTGCREAAAPHPEPAAAARAATTPSASPATPVHPLVVFLGDSLTAGLGLDEDQAFPALLAERLAAGDQPIRAVNAGISGDTTAGGLERLDWLLRQAPDVLVVALGANDGLRAKDVTTTEDNLRQIVERSRAAGAQVLLAGMRMPPNYGADYATAFAAIFPRLAAELDVALVPFLLEGVAADPELNQADGIHPNARGHERMAEVVLPHLRRLLEDLQSGRRL